MHHLHLFVAAFRELANIISVDFVHQQGHAWHKGSGQRQHLAVILGLTCLEPEAILIADLVHISELIPTRYVALGEGDQVITDSDTILRVVVVDKQILLRTTHLTN